MSDITTFPISSETLKAFDENVRTAEEYMRQSELLQTLTSDKVQRDYLQKLMVHSWFKLLRNGTYVIRPERFASSIDAFADAHIDVQDVHSLHDAWDIIKRCYFAPYIQWKQKGLNEHINMTKATDLYSVADVFLKDNNLWMKHDKVCYIFPIINQFHTDRVVCLIASSSSKKAYILFADGWFEDVVWANIDVERLQTLQDFLDNKWL